MGGETLAAGPYRLDVHWTPGHAPGHLCLHDPTLKLLLSGEHVLPHTTPTIGLHPFTDSDPLGDFIRSLRRTATLETDRTFPAHGESFGGVEPRMDQILAHHTNRSDDIRDVVSGPAKTGWNVARTIGWSVGDFKAFNVENTTLAVLETLAHLKMAPSLNQHH